MALLIQQNDVGEYLREPMMLDRRRRRLSTVVKRHRLHRNRPHIVSVHRKNSALVPADDSVRLRKTWKHIWIGPEDVVVITYLPLGGMGGGGSKGGKNIGAMLGMLLLSIFVPMAVGALGAGTALASATGSLTMLGKIVSMGIIAGIGYLISKATQPKANKEKEKETYGVSGGGNIARAGDRIPVNYGRTWTQPDLTQADYFTYAEVGAGSDPDDQILFKRMCLGLGKYQIHTIKVGDAVAWTEEHGLQAPFENMELEFIEPGQTSDLVPGAVYSSPNVTGIDMGHSDDPLPWKGPFPLTEPGKRTRRAQLDVSWPNGYYYTGKHGKGDVGVGVQFQMIQIDDDGVEIGDYQNMVTIGRAGIATGAVRVTRYVNVDQTKRWAIRARPTHANHTDEDEISVVDQTYWDGLRAHMFNEPARPFTTEIAMKVSANAMGSTTAFSDVWVEATKILPVYNNGTWTEQPTRNAVWAFADIVRNGDYGGAVNDLKFDTLTAEYYAENIPNGYNTFDGQIRGPVSVFEAAQTVLGVVRAEPVVMGDTWSMTRDEPRDFTKHTITRRQVIKDTSGINFDLDMTTGESDVIVEYYSQADPKRRNEVRETIGALTITPRRVQGFGISSERHARHFAKWMAATAYYRREERAISVEMQGRIFQRNENALIDIWFLNATQAAGVEERDGLMLTLDNEVDVGAEDYLVIRNSKGLQWGPVKVTAGEYTDEVLLDGDDVAAVESSTGQTLTSIFANRADKKLPLSVMIGPLQEMTQGYLIRSAKFSSETRMEITAVNDAPEVWSILGESIPDGPDIPSVIDTSITVPILPYVTANIIQYGGSIALKWAVGRAQDANRYQVQIAYGDGTNPDNTYFTISDGAATDGTYPVHFDRNMTDPTVRVRARVINRLGVPSQWKFTTTSLFLPIVNPELADLEVTIEALSDQLRYEIELISGTGEGSLLELRQNVETLIDQLGSAVADYVAETYEKTETIKVIQSQDKADVFAALLAEQQARATADETLASDIQALAAQNGEGMAALIAVEREARINADGVLTQQITDLSSTLNDTISGEATARFQLTTRVTNLEGQVQSNSLALTNLNTTLDGHSSTLTVLGQSLNGISLQYGIVGNIDGVTGGFLFTGVRRLDGTVVYNVKISGDVFVDGSITGRKLSGTSLIISGRAQVGSLVIGTDQLIDGSVSNVLWDQGTPPHILTSLRGNPAVILWVTSSVKTDDPGSYIYVLRNGTRIGAIPRNVVTERGVDIWGNSTTTYTVTFDLGMFVDTPSPGSVSYTFEYVSVPTNLRTTGKIVFLGLQK